MWVSNLNRKLVPIIIGISLTTLSCVSLVLLLYPMLGKDDDVKDDNTKRRKSGHIVRSRPITIQCKIPKQFVSAVIGRGGFVIKDIQNKTGTYLKMDDEDIDSLNRVCTIRGNDMESICLAESMIKNIIDNQPIIETYQLLLPYEAGGILKRNGHAMRIQMATGVKIIIDRNPYKSEGTKKQRIVLKGTTEQIALAVTEIEDQIRKENEIQAQLKNELAGIEKRPKSALSLRDNNPSNMPNNNILKPLEISLSQDGFISVYVTAMETPSRFWIQVVGPGNIALCNLVSEMTEYYDKEENRELHALKKITQGQMVAAKFGEDQKWYRAEVEAVLDSQCEVWFVDYGDMDVVSKEHILELRTDMLSLRSQAVECSLANVKPIESNWDNRAVDKFAELVSLSQWKTLTGKVRGYKERVGSRREGSPIPCFDLYDKDDDDKDVNIGETLVRLKLAQFEEEICNRSAVNSTPSLDRCDSPRSSSSLTEHRTTSKEESEQRIGEIRNAEIQREN